MLVLSRLFYGCYLKKHFSTIDRPATSYTELIVHIKHEITLIKCSIAIDKRYLYIFVLIPLRYPP